VDGERALAGPTTEAGREAPAKGGVSPTCARAPGAQRTGRRRRPVAAWEWFSASAENYGDTLAGASEPPRRAYKGATASTRGQGKNNDQLRRGYAAAARPL